MKNIFKFILIFCFIPLGCNPSKKININQQISFSYEDIQGLVNKIEINKSVLSNLFGVNQIKITDSKGHKDFSHPNVLNAYNNQLIEIINAMKTLNSKTRKNYFNQMNLILELSPTTKNEIVYSNKSLQLTLSTHHNINNVKNSYLGVINEKRIYSFLSKNLTKL